MFKIDTKESLREALIELTKRPGLFVGTDRFDYLSNLSLGWGLVADEYPWDDDYEIQEWILLRESASINSTSIQGRSLITRCYGNRIYAIDRYRELLENVEFRSSQTTGSATVSNLIIGISSSYKENGYSFYAGCAPENLRQAVKALTQEVTGGYEGILQILSRIIDEPYDDIWVYLHYAGCFMCVKFLFHTENGWKENDALSGGECYFQNLLILHAYADFVKNEEQRNHIITLRSHQGVASVSCEETMDKWQDFREYDDNTPFCISYAKWKEKFAL